MERSREVQPDEAIESGEVDRDRGLRQRPFSGSSGGTETSPKRLNASAAVAASRYPATGIAFRIA
jgi:hypothetical protein